MNSHHRYIHKGKGLRNPHKIATALKALNARGNESRGQDTGFAGKPKGLTKGQICLLLTALWACPKDILTAPSWARGETSGYKIVGIP